MLKAFKRGTSAGPKPIVLDSCRRDTRATLPRIQGGTCSPVSGLKRTEMNRLSCTTSSGVRRVMTFRILDSFSGVLFKPCCGIKQASFEAMPLGSSKCRESSMASTSFALVWRPTSKFSEKAAASKA